MSSSPGPTGTSSTAAARWLLGAVLALFVGLAVWYSVTIPLGEAPDEVPHFTYVRYLAQQGHLPTTRDEHEAFQPPLYYALGAALTFWVEDAPGAPFAVRANADFDVADPRAPKNLLLHTADESWPYRGWALAWHLVRLLSIGFGAASVWAVYRLGRVLAPTQPAVALTMSALTAFTPQFLFMSAVVNNDNAAVGFSALVLWQAAALLREERSARLGLRSATLGILLGLGMLSKASSIALAPVVGLAILVAAWRSHLPSAGARARLAMRCLFFAGASAALIAGWYFLRNLALFGDPLGWSFLLEINARREGAVNGAVLAWLASGIFRSFWLGWVGISFPRAVYWVIGGICLVGAGGFGAWWLARRREIDAPTHWTLALLGVHSLLIGASLLKWTATVLGTDQARLIYPTLPTVMFVLTAGWAFWVRGPARRAVLGGLAAGMLALAVATPLCIIGPIHAPAPVASPDELAAAIPLDVDWDGVRLLGYRLEGDEATPGGKLVLHLYWQALRPVKDDILALIQLVDREGKFLMYTDGSPTAGRDTTDRWTPGVALASRHLLPIPEYGLPGEYRLTISLHRFGEQGWLPAVGQGGDTIGEHLVLPETVRLVAP